MRLPPLLADSQSKYICIHGGMPQASRDRVMSKFRSGGLRFLGATDVAGNVSTDAPPYIITTVTITATNDGSRMFKFNGGTTLDEIVHAVNAVGAAPGDLIAILEALKQAGALSAELEVI